MHYLQNLVGSDVTENVLVLLMDCSCAVWGVEHAVLFIAIIVDL